VVRSRIIPPPPRSGSAEYVDVRTFPAGTTTQQAIAELGYDRQHNTPPGDQVVITGSGFVVIVSPAEHWNRPDAVRNWPVPPATIAARVHGTVLSPAS
jgi:hypothetical protein